MDTYPKKYSIYFIQTPESVQGSVKRKGGWGGGKEKKKDRKIFSKNNEYKY